MHPKTFPYAYSAFLRERAIREVKLCFERRQQGMEAADAIEMHSLTNSYGFGD